MGCISQTLLSRQYAHRLWDSFSRTNIRKALDQGVFVPDGASLVACFCLGSIDKTAWSAMRGAAQRSKKQEREEAYFSSSSGGAESLRVTCSSEVSTIIGLYLDRFRLSIAYVVERHDGDKIVC